MKEFPEIRRISIWLDNHLWKLDEYTSIKVATHKGWIAIEFEPHKQYWGCVNRGWKLVSEVKIRLDERNRQLIIYLTFIKETGEYKPRGYLPVDVNEDNATILVDEWLTSLKPIWRSLSSDITIVERSFRQNTISPMA
ncbi:MAG: hypothetical protein J7L55_05935 [Desulfurococcales archaeon]|nr:hypothetical protein [Desulfurococcales archaeon]